MATEQDVQAPVFEVEHFGLRGDRLQIEGRWSGVRGLRFVRPTLTLVSGDGRRRLLASLEDKPWSPDAETWVASFPWPDGELVAETAELAVGPSLVVDLPAPEGAKKARPRADSGRFATATPTEPRDALTASRDAAAAERDVLRAELAAVIAERDRLRGELEAAQGSGGAEKERAKRALTDLAAERDDLRRQLDAAQRAAGEATTAAERAQHALAAAEADRDDAQRRVAGVEAQRDEARERAAKLEAQRDEARAECDAAKREASRPAPAPSADPDALEALRRERDAAVQRATVLQAERNAAVSARDEAVADRDAAMRARPVAPPPAPAAVPAHLRTQRDAPSVTNSWLMRITASLATIVVLIVAALLLTN